MRGIVIKKPVIAKKPSSFTVKSKSPTSYKNGVKKSREIGKSLEHYTNDWLEGRISDKDYNALKNDLYRQQERLINSNYMKTYSVTMTEEELKLFSEFLEQRDYSKKELTDEEEDLVKQISYLTVNEREKLKKQFENEKFLKSVVKDQIKEDGSSKDIIGTVGGLVGAGTGLGAAWNNNGIDIPRTDLKLTPYGSAALGYIGGRVVGGTMGAIGDSIRVNQAVKEYRKEPNNPRYKEINEEAEKNRNLIDVAEGRMNKSDFAKKWHKKSASVKKEF